MTDMVNFHEHKLWQECFVALMDIHEALDETDASDHDAEVVRELLEAAQKVAAVVADSLTRKDRRVAQELMYDAVGLVAVTRTHLAVAWGRALLDDNTFKKLDASYDSISTSLQQYK